MAVAFNNTNTLARTGLGSPVTESTFSVTAGSNLCAVCWIVLKQTGSANIPSASVTWNGVSMTQVSTAWDSTNGAFISGFTLAAPASGVHDLVMTFSAGSGGTITDLYYDLVSYTGVDQTTCARASSWSTALNQTADGSKHVTLTVTNSVVDDMVADCWVQIVPQNNTGVGTSWTERGQSGAGNFNHVSCADTASTATSMIDTVTCISASTCCTTLAGFSIQQVSTTIAPNLNEAVTVAESVTMHMPISLRMGLPT